MQPLQAFCVKGSVLVLDNTDDYKIIMFPGPIKQLEFFDTIVVARLKVSAKNNMTENVFGASRRGKIIWQIPKLEDVNGGIYYDNIFKEDDMCVSSSRDGWLVWLDPSTGNIVKKIFKENKDNPAL